MNKLKENADHLEKLQKLELEENSATKKERALKMGSDLRFSNYKLKGVSQTASKMSVKSSNDGPIGNAMTLQARNKPVGSGT